MNTNFREYTIIFVSAAIVLSISAFCILASMHDNHSKFVYALDDAYIHLALAKHLAQDGIWGVSRFYFTASVSSILWQVLLASFFWIFGVWELLPLILNLFLTIALVYLLAKMFEKFRYQNWWTVLWIPLILFVATVPGLILSGLEHILQIIVDFYFIYLAAKFLSEERKLSFKRDWGILLFAMLITAARFEGLFIIAAVIFLSILQKKWRSALWIAIFSAIPIVIYGIISVSNGWYFFPNSVLLKGNKPTNIAAFLHGIFSLALFKPPFYHPFILLLMTLFSSIFYWVKSKKIWQFKTVFSIIILLILLQHIMFGRFGHFFRYEAYLIVLVSFLFLISISDFLKNVGQNAKTIIKIAVITLSILLFLPLAVRGFYAVKVARIAPTNIYNQQYQMARFLKKYYNGDNVVIGDIGAVNFFADLKITDMNELADIELLKLRNLPMKKRVEIVTKQRHSKIAIIYGEAYRKMNTLPEYWRKVGEWTIPNNVICADSTVEFFAVDTMLTDELKFNFKKFSKELPKNIKMKYIN